MYVWTPTIPFVVMVRTLLQGAFHEKKYENLVNCSESTENKDIFGKLRIRPILLLYFQPRTRWCCRGKTTLRIFDFLVHMTHETLNFSFSLR